VQIIGQKKVDQAAQDHADWRASLRNWITVVKGADWANNNDIQQTFNTADPVGFYVVFNIAHNKARLVSIVDFADERVTVKEVVSHARYDRKNYR
jgi:mRNA interferase HigB